MRRLVLSLAAALAVLALSVASIPGSTQVGHRLNPAIETALAAEQGRMPPRLPNGNLVPLPSGALVQSVEQGLRIARHEAPLASAQGVVPPTVGTTGCSNAFTAPGFPDNVRANQGCGATFQAEEWVAANPTDPSDVVVSMNDASLSGNHTGVYYSVDGGAHFGDSHLPAGRENFSDAPPGAWSFDFFSDPAHAFDSRGNLYYSAIGGDFLEDGFTGVFVWKSNSCLEGAALHSPGEGSCRPFRAPHDPSARAIDTNFHDPSLLDDKEMIAADASPSSPHRDNVYVTWTRFRFHCGTGQSGYCESPILFSRSHDHGVTWSPAKVISGIAGICDFGNAFDPQRPEHACNADQASFPVVGPDGTIYVVFLNSNVPKKDETAGGPVNQFLVVKSTDAGRHWTRPVRVARDIATEPFSVPGREIQDCDLLRQCLPPNGYRLWDEPSMGIDPTTGKLAVFWQDFRNGGPCHHAFELPAPPCANYNSDVFASVSTDGGASWSRHRLVTGNAGTTTQWQSWGDVGPNGKLYVAYYDREYGDCESTGCNDITLATSGDDGHHWSHRRITTSSMPNLGCDVNPFECGFLGDYMSLQVSGGTVVIAWADTRGLGGTAEEDVYYATVPG